MFYIKKHLFCKINWFYFLNEMYDNNHLRQKVCFVTVLTFPPGKYAKDVA